MRPYEAVARIFLFLSIVNFTFAGVAQARTMHEMRIDLMTGAEDVTEALERGHTQPEELPEWSGRPSTAGHLHSRMDPLLMEYLVLETIDGVFSGISNGVQDEIAGTVSPNAETINRAVEPLNEHRQDQEDLVSRSLSNMRDEDLQMLSIISRRMLNRLH
ncbi:hypothetical protein F5888DRAFT_700631 [Russula emetica]|nr:hypothetical protein F5888DRAFT_700631 [Russula emetica]